MCVAIGLGERHGLRVGLDHPSNIARIVGVERAAVILDARRPCPVYDHILHLRPRVGPIKQGGICSKDLDRKKLSLRDRRVFAQVAFSSCLRHFAHPLIYGQHALPSTRHDDKTDINHQRARPQPIPLSGSHSELEWRRSLGSACRSAILCAKLAPPSTDPVIRT